MWYHVDRKTVAYIWYHVYGIYFIYGTIYVYIYIYMVPCIHICIYIYIYIYIHRPFRGHQVCETNFRLFKIHQVHPIHPSDIKSMNPLSLFVCSKGCLRGLGGRILASLRGWGGKEGGKQSVTLAFFFLMSSYDASCWSAWRHMCMHVTASGIMSYFWCRKPLKMVPS